MNRVLAGFGIGIVTGALIVPVTAMADATIESVTHFGGVMGMAASDIHTISEIKGLKERKQSTVKFKGAVLGALQNFAGHAEGSDTVDIYRVDKDLQWTLDPKAKHYTEQSLSAPPKGAGANRSGADSDNGHIKITKNEVDVKDTGKTQTINGFATHEYVVTWTVEAVDEKTGKRSTSLMTSDIWASTDKSLAKVHDEQAAFNKALLEKKHEDVDSLLGKQYGFGALRILGATNTEQLGKALGKVKGMPVRTSVTWETSGQAGADTQGDSQAAERAKAAAAMAKLSALLGNSTAQQSAADTAHPGMTKIFDSTTEVTKVSTATLPASTFEVPAGYSKN